MRSANRERRTRHLMLLPSGACQAHCEYCFGPNRGAIMAPETFDAALEWIAATTAPGERVEVTFHGGEPLLAGHAWYARNLPLLRARFGSRLALHVQSNLWLLDDAYCELFEAHGVAVGTSLDGPEAINDAQRGAGCFARTMAGVAVARRHGLTPGVVCTFTRLSAPHYREVCDFFAEEGLAFGVHAAVPALGAPGGRLSLSPEEHGALFVELFDYYLENITRMRISTLDATARGISAGEGGLCTFRDCLGGYLTIDPGGALYTCNRLAGHAEWCVGRVQDGPDLAVLARAPAWARLREREERVNEECAGCAHFAYCRGGCAYNALVAGGMRDPHCVAYRRVFAHITDRALQQVFADENLEAVVADGARQGGLLRSGALLQIMRGGPHPQRTARRARELVASVALASTASVEEALERLGHAGLVTRPDAARASLAALQARLCAPAGDLLNVYLHVTYACNLACAHCYAESGPRRAEAPMAVDDVVRLVRAAAAAGFAKAVITGGEPLAHPERGAVLGALGALRGTCGPLQIVLRTNLAYPATDELLGQIAQGADQIVVSLDGDEATHDGRRGRGTFARTVCNLRALLGAWPRAQVGLSATLTGEQMAGPERAALRALAAELGLPVRFKPVLPLGRAAGVSRVPEAFSSREVDGVEALACGLGLGASCGLGMNLYIAPGGECYPCYALVGARHALGNALRDGVQAVVGGERFARYRAVTVDSNRRCHACALRYVCGGACRAWSAGDDPDEGPRDCTALEARARAMLREALGALGVGAERWAAAGLPGVWCGEG